MRLISAIPFFRQRKKLVSGAFILALLGGIVAYSVQTEEILVTEPEKTLKSVSLVQVSSFIQEPAKVITIGTVQSAQQVEIRAESNGKITGLFVREGDRIGAGGLIAEIDHQTLDAQVLQAEARLSSAQASLDRLRMGDRPEEIAILQEKLNSEQQRLSELERGARPEEVEITLTQLKNAQQSLVDARKSLENARQTNERSLHTLLVNTPDRIRSASSTVKKILGQTLQEIIYPDAFPGTLNCRLHVLSVYSGNIVQACNDAWQASLKVQVLADEISRSLETDEAVDKLETTLEELEKIQSFLTQVFEMVKGTYSIIVDFRDRQISNDELAALKMQVTTAQSEIESELSILRSHLETLKTQVVLNTTSLDNAENLVSERENAVHLLERELDLKKVSATEEQLEIQRSNIRQMELQLEISQKGARDEDVRAQEASVQQARAEVSLATISRNMSIISTPIGGSVMSLKIDYGDYVNTGEVIALIANEGAIEVQTFIPETDTELLGTAGIQVRIQGSDAKGKVTLISPAVDTETKKVEVTVSLAEGYELLLIGQTVFLEFATQLSPDNRYVPISALKVTQDQSFVFTVNDQSEVQAISITVKSVRGDLVEVEGITDDQLIIPKVSGLREGEEVTIEEAKSSSFSLQSQPSQPSQPSQ